MRKLKFKKVSICRELCAEVRIDFGCLCLSACLFQQMKTAEVIGEVVCRDDKEEFELK